MSEVTTAVVELPPLSPRISDYVDWYAQRTPCAIALVLNEQRISYRVLRDEVNKLAKALIQSGVNKGDRVATLCPPSPDYFIAFLAAASIGAIWVGLNPKYQLNELAYVTGDCKPVVLIARSFIDGADYTARLKELMALSPSISSLVILDNEIEPAAKTISYQNFLAGGVSISDEHLQKIRQACGDRDPCLIVYTSGSTGKPKGALLHHQGIVAASIEQNRFWPISSLSMLNYFPINHVGCVVDISTPIFVAGGTIVFMEKFLARQSLEIMEQEKITLWASVPSVFQIQFSEPEFEQFDLSAVKLIVWEGSVMPSEMIKRLLTDYDCPLATNYGMSESCGAITSLMPTRDLSLLAKTVGMPISGVEINLVDGKGKSVEQGCVGEILTRSKYNMLGYWNRPEASAQAITEDGWFSTGDLAHQNSDGSFSIRGRIKEMYKSGGYNVYPREVENVIESFPDVEIAAVVSIDDPVWQEVGIAYVLQNKEIQLADLVAYCREKLANYKMPKHFALIDEIPLLPIGKVDKVSLKKLAKQQYAKQ